MIGSTPLLLRLFQVPITLYFMTQAYFALYHALSNVMIRKARRSVASYGPRAETAVEIAVVFLFSYSTAYMETLTISHFPYYTHKVGAALAFILHKKAFCVVSASIPTVWSEQGPNVHSRQFVLRHILFRLFSHVLPDGRGSSQGEY